MFRSPSPLPRADLASILVWSYGHKVCDTDALHSSCRVHSKTRASARLLYSLVERSQLARVFQLAHECMNGWMDGELELLLSKAVA